MFDYLVSGTKNIFRKKLRSFLTILGIAIGVLSVVIISTIGEVGKVSINSEIDSIGMSGLTVRTADGESNLYTSQLDEIETLADVYDAMPLMLEYTQCSMRNIETDCAVWGIDGGAQNVVDMELLYGRFLNQSDVASGENVCIVDESYAQSVYKRSNIVGKTMQVSLGGRLQEFTVIGVVKTGGSLMQGIVGTYVPCFVYMPYTTLKNETGKSNFDQIVVKLYDDTDPQKTVKEIELAISGLDGEAGGIRVENLAEQREQLDHVLEIVAAVLSVIAGISLVVAGLSIMTVMFVSVSERTREIGIKKSIGASRGKIMTEFLAESFLISSIGSGIGACVGIIFSVIGCLLVGFTPQLNWSMILISMVFAAGVGVLFGVYPALQAAKLRPVDALHCEN